MLDNTPLAEILRPKTIDDYVGQKHLVGENTVIRNAILSGNIPSMILWGPPGVGKTSLANIIANSIERPFYNLSAINSGVKDIRDVVDKSKNALFKPILFIDEIHRFSKSQQDSLLSAVEKGIVTLIGATTENPSFEVITPLLSRCQVYILKELNKDDLYQIIDISISYLEKKYKKEFEFDNLDVLLRISGGDARKLINAVELVVCAIPHNSDKIIISEKEVLNIVQQNLSAYDKNGEQHYDIVSAFIKSIRGSDPNAAVYWLARMIEGGEDPKFIARRLLILASEDVGNANPNALLLANNCFTAVNVIGYPECRIILSQCVIYLANSPKSNSSYQAINTAQQLVKKTGKLSVPLHLRNAPTKLMKELDYGKDYKYAHAFKESFINQEFMPDDIQGEKLYEPGDNPAEKKTRERLQNLWKEKYKY